MAKKKPGGINRAGLTHQGDEEYLELTRSLYSGNRFTCRSCYWYEIPDGHQAACMKQMFAGFPSIGEKCRKFCYEPGTDEGEN